MVAFCEKGDHFIFRDDSNCKEYIWGVFGPTLNFLRIEVLLLVAQDMLIFPSIENTLVEPAVCYT